MLYWRCGSYAKFLAFGYVKLLAWRICYFVGLVDMLSCWPVGHVKLLARFICYIFDLLDMLYFWPVGYVLLLTR
jgi:hypothetical protein